MNSPDNNTTSIATRSSLKYRLIVLLIFACAVLIGVWLTRPSDVPAVPPQVPDIVDKENVDPKIQEVINRARERVQSEPNSGAAWGQLGLLFFVHEFSGQANECFRRAATLDLRDPRWPYFLALQTEAVDREAARAWLKDATKRSPRNPFLMTRIAELEIESGVTDAARKNLNAVVRANPHAARALFRLALIEANQGDAQTALNLAQQALSASPQQIAIIELIAKLHHRLEQPAEAERALEQLTNSKMLSRDWPDPFVGEAQKLRVDASWRMFQATQLVSRGDVDKGLRALEELAVEQPNVPSHWLALGQAYLQANQPKQAVDALDRAKQLHPDNFAIVRLSGGCTMTAGDWTAAIQDLAEASRMRPADAGIRIDLGVCHRELMQLDEAVAMFRSATEGGVEVAARIELARTFIQQELLGAANNELTLVLRLEPENSTAIGLKQQLDSMD